MNNEIITSQTIKVTRQLYDMKASEFAKLIGVGTSSLTNYENGYFYSKTVSKRFYDVIGIELITEVNSLINRNHDSKE